MGAGCRMKRSFKVAEFTSLDDIAQWAAVDAADEIELRVTAVSGFAPTVEGVALSTLQQLAKRTSLTAECSVEAAKASKLFDSLFGLSLSLASRAVTGPNGEEQKNLLSTRLWQRVLQARGQVGTGNHVSIVFRDPDYWLPQCLRGSEAHFPTRDVFRSTLLTAAQGMGFPRSFSNTEQDVITFLYEATQNSHDHARVGPDGRAVSGIRGILLDRVTVTSAAELDNRRDLSEFQRAYIRRSKKGVPDASLFFAFTVADLGAGIHNTLPSTPGESSWATLNRAFSAGQTRKPRGAGLEAGQGLAKVWGSAKRLRALLFVKSAELVGYMDFSTGGEEVRLIELPTRLGETGTSLTMMWPSTKTGGDQGSLFE